jgi:hypothetical protein
MAQSLPEMAGFEIRGKVNPIAFAAWVFQRYQKATKKRDGEALEYILERWANLDPEAQRYGVSVEAFRREVDGGQVVPIRQLKREGTHGDSSEAERNGAG